MVPTYTGIEHLIFGKARGLSPLFFFSFCRL